MISNQLSYFKKTKFYHFIQEIVLSNIIRIISQFFRSEIDDNLIILGAYGGEAFVDNSKYLYRYLVQNTNYKVVWVAKSEKLIKEMRRNGYNIIKKYSLNTIRLLRQAKYIFTTHGIFDVLPIQFSENTIFISLWHGVQNKRNETEHGPIHFPKLARFLKLPIVNDIFIDFFITTSGTSKDKELIVNYFQISSKKIRAFGYPRNDILFSDELNLKIRLKTKYNIPAEIKKVYLYAPTFRDYKMTAEFPLSNEELENLNEILVNTHSLMILKAHMFEKTVDFKNYTNMLVLHKETDIQELLCFTDVLITDYSSVYCDFLLLNKPILFFTYDYKEFMTYGRGFYYDFEKIVPGPLLYNANELINAILNIEQIGKDFEDKRLKTRKIYHKYVDGKSTERLLSFLEII